MLGAGSGYEDMLYANQYCRFVVSHDSSSAFWNGVHEKTIGYTLHEEKGEEVIQETMSAMRVAGGKTKEAVDFNYKDATERQLKLVQYNINIIKEKLCNSTHKE